MFKAASLQLEINDQQTKQDRIEYALEQMEISKDADLILLPEIWNTGYFNFDLYREESETLDGMTVNAVAEKARDINSYVFAGSFVENVAGKLYNTSVMLDNKGKIIGTYRKIHLFGYKSREKELLTPGKEAVVVKTELGALGLSTCYDLRFPELYRFMLDRGAEIFLVTSGWPFPRWANWLALNQVRALENVCYLISCNCAGINRGRVYLGHSCIVDPRGIIRAGSNEEPCIVTGTIDLDRVHRLRTSIAQLKDRTLKFTGRSYDT